MKVEFKGYVFYKSKSEVAKNFETTVEFWVTHVGCILTCITCFNAISQSRLKVERTSITKVEVDSLLCKDTGVHTDCAKSSLLDFDVHITDALWFGFSDWGNVCLLMSRKPFCFINICGESDHSVFFEIHRANTHYNVEFVRISVCRNSSWAAASFIHQWARRPAPLMLGKLSLQVAEPRW